MAVLQEEWEIIQEFPNYEVSNLGNVFNRKRNRMLSPSMNNYGDLRVLLTSEIIIYYMTDDGNEVLSRPLKRTLSLKRLVADYFCEPPDLLSDTPIQLDNNLYNCRASNLAFRPRWFAWRYRHQFNVPQPKHYKNLGVMNTKTGDEYRSIIECGMTEGLLFDDIWISVNTGHTIYPVRAAFDIVDPLADL